ncbi:MAG: hypothetical protein ABSE22_00825 [Xanthobacteraceae bacterium]|jgi:hypothetical protein
MAKKRRVTGLPRTAQEAKDRGYTKVKPKLNPHEMDSAVKKKWTFVSSKDVTHGAIGAWGPHPDTGTHTVCYFDEDDGQYDDCRQVPS